jgi:lysophospholipase L1-like esterase
MKPTLRIHASLGLALAIASLAPQARAQTQPVWIATWGASQQIPEPQNALPPADLTDTTLRQIVHLSAGGNALRVHLSNAFGTEPLHITSAHLARPLALDAPAIDPQTDRALTFAGLPDVTILAGAEYISDPLPLTLPALSDVAITIHFDAPPTRETSHPGSRATSWFVHGDQVSAPTFTNPNKIDHWFQLSEVDIQSTPSAATIVTLGDSITDGHAATTNGNTRWPDALAAHLQQSPATQNIGVSNQGIGGNHLLTDGLGPNALARFDRDVLAPAGVHWVILLEGVNDLGGLTRDAEVSPEKHAAFVQRILASYEQIITRAHAHNLRVFGATITPYLGSDYYHPCPLSEADRQTINTWIRTPNHFDAVIDFDAIVRDPANPTHLLPAYDSGDHLHPSPAGYKAMGDSIPLTLFTP